MFTHYVIVFYFLVNFFTAGYQVKDLKASAAATIVLCLTFCIAGSFIYAIDYTGEFIVWLNKQTQFTAFYNLYFTKKYHNMSKRTLFNTCENMKIIENKKAKGKKLTHKEIITLYLSKKVVKLNNYTYITDDDNDLDPAGGRGLHSHI